MSWLNDFIKRDEIEVWKNEVKDKKSSISGKEIEQLTIWDI